MSIFISIVATDLNEIKLERNSRQANVSSGMITHQSQKTEGFCVADFATLSDERRSRSKNFSTVYMDKRTLRSKI